MRRYLTTSTASFDEVASAVWNDSVAAEQYTGATEKYQAAILDQYKMYVEMADRISARRGLTNTFFLTLNTLILTTAGVLWKDRPTVAVWHLSIPAVVLVLQCAAWFWLLRSYRQLNSGKYIIIGVLEQRLPASPYWRGEWKALGEGRDPSRYWPLTYLEKWIPVSFAGLYAVGFLIALIA
ncbi:RipA family octameric membrane protein [Micromonospora sp. LA-10]|uniref:RipA family octameric membrane protein n=1 Tax=Micromonospora sp. LA-10 TaxID=3446364 RepID=UPI003F7149F0